MKKALSKSKNRINRTKILIDHRRINWNSETNHRIRWEFEKFSITARGIEFPFEFRVNQHDTPNEGVIELIAEQILTGQVNRKITNLFSENPYSDTPVIESEGRLTASQSDSGHIFFTASLRRSDRRRPLTREVFLLHSLDPTEVTANVIRKALKRYLLILQDSSLWGDKASLTLSERLLIQWIMFRDLRRQHKFYRSILLLKNEWLKIAIPVLATVLITFAAGYFTGKPSEEKLNCTRATECSANNPEEPLTPNATLRRLDAKDAHIQ